jgi:ATP-binding cassette subfamily B protein
MSNDIEALTELLSTSIVMVASNMVTLVGIIITMFAINWRLALLGLAVLPIMTAATIYWRKKIRESSSLVHKVIAEYLAFLNEQFNGMLVVQLFGRQPESRAGLDEVNEKYRQMHRKMRDAYTGYASVLQFLTSVGLAIVLYGGGQGVLAGWATLGMLIAFIEYTRRSFEPINQLAEQFAQIQMALSAGERIARMLRVESSIADPTEPVTLTETRHSFGFEHVTFSYDEGGHSRCPPIRSSPLCDGCAAKPLLLQRHDCR